MRTTRAAIALVMTVLAGATASACSSGDDGGRSKAGGPAAPVTLTLGIDDIAGQTFSARQVEEFARQVYTLSGGHLRVAPVWRAAGSDVRDWDQAVARRVIEGDIDMGWIPTRAWDSLGVSTFRALNAPLLVTTPSLTDAITGSKHVDIMLRGLSAKGVVGIGLFPDGLRHPVSFTAPLRSAADYRGRHLRMPTSETADALAVALGADSDDYAGTFPDKVASGEVTAAESSFELAGNLPAAGIGTGNVTFYPKVNSLVVNARRHSGLTAAERDLLSRAAVATRRWAVVNQLSESEAASAFCRAGGTVVLASATDLESLRAAVEPVYRQLRADAITAELVVDFTAMAATAERADLARACSPTSGADTVGQSPPPPSSATSTTSTTSTTSASSAAGPGDPSVVNGSYRFEVTDTDLASAGITDRGDVMENHGVYTWTLRDGAWRWEAKAVNVQYNPVGTGTYTVSGDRITFHYPGHGAPLTYRYTLTDEGLQLHEVEPGPDAIQTVLMAVKVWRRVG